MRPRIFLFVAVLLLLAWLVARSLFAPPPPETTLSFSVRADLGWQDTGVSVRPGDTLAVRHVSGEWCPWPEGCADGLGVGGDPGCDCNLLLGASHGALIGRVGDARPFLVGNDFLYRMGGTGTLFLMINDRNRFDNTGQIVVQIRQSS